MTNEVVINPVTNVVEISAPGPQGSAGSAFTPAADSGSGSPVSSTLSVIGGTNVTTSVNGTRITVNASGGGTGTVTQVNTGTGLSGGGFTTSGTISIANTAVTPAEYAVGKFTVDQQGRITAASAGLKADVTALFPANVASLLNASDSAGMRTVLGVKNHATIEADTTPQYFENLVESNDTQEFITNSGLTNYLAQTSQNLADLNSSATALTNLGGTTVGKAVFAAASQAAARSAIGVGTGTGDMVGSNNLSEITSESTARTNLGLGTAATSATGDFSPVAGSGSITTVGTITSGTWSGTAIGYGSLSGKPSLGTASQYNAGIGSNSILQADANVADDDFLRVAGTKIEGRTAAQTLEDIGGQAALTFGISNTNAVKVDAADVADDEYARFTASGLESRTAAEVLTDIGAQAALTAPVTSPAMTGVSAGSITGIIQCSSSQYAAITRDPNTLYVIV